MTPAPLPSIRLCVLKNQQLNQYTYHVLGLASYPGAQEDLGTRLVLNLGLQTSASNLIQLISPLHSNLLRVDKRHSFLVFSLQPSVNILPSYLDISSSGDLPR